MCESAFVKSLCVDERSCEKEAHSLYIVDSTTPVIFPLKAQWSLAHFVPKLGSWAVQRLSILPKVTVVMEIKMSLLK